MSNTPFELFSPEHTALLVVDKQHAYTDEKLLIARHRHLPKDILEIEQKIEDTIVFARKNGVPVIWTQMTEDIHLSPETIRRKMEIYPGPDISAIPGSIDYKISGTILPTSNELIIEKKHYDAFSEPALIKYLSEKGVTSVILVGGFLPRCVLGTAYGANNNDLHVLLLEDLTFEPIEFSQDRSATLRIVDAILGYVDNSQNLLASWSS